MRGTHRKTGINAKPLCRWCASIATNVAPTRFAQRLADGQGLLMYEMLPPFASASDAKRDAAAQRVGELVAGLDVAAINIPEVRNEARTPQERPAQYQERMEPWRFASALRRAVPDAAMLINHPTVYEPADAFDAWLDARVAEDLRDIVLVGGESSQVTYPGPGPVDAARRALARHPGLNLGGISIPTRAQNGFANEGERMLAKQRAGVSHFTTQVVFEAQTTQRMLADYAAACHGAGVAPVPVFVSLAPITNERDADFLQWLGAEIPAATRQWILEANGHAAQRSVEAAAQVVTEVSQFIARKRLGVTLGINVEHVMQANIEVSGLLLRRARALLDAPAAEHASA